MLGSCWPQHLAWFARWAQSLRTALSVLPQWSRREDFVCAAPVREVHKQCCQEHLDIQVTGALKLRARLAMDFLGCKSIMKEQAYQKS